MASSLAKAYLIIYNCILLTLCVVAVIKMLSFNIVSNGIDGFPKAGTFEKGSPFVKILFIAQYLEIVHTAIGLTKGSPIICAIQVLARSLVYFAFLDSEPRVHNNKSSGLMLIVWCLGDIARYPFYILKLLNVQFYPVVWLRYSSWILLYPMGFILEGIVAYNNWNYLEESGTLSYSMPNQFNFAFHMSTFLYYYIPALPLGGFVMMSYMKSQRDKVLASSKSLKTM